MSRAVNCVALLLLLMFLCMGPIANNVSSQDEKEDFWRIVQTVQDILAGKNVEQGNAAIAQGARLIYGERFEDLKGVVAGENKTCSLADTSYHGVMIQARTNPSEDMGFIILKTQTSDRAKVRFHTIVLLKDSTGQYKIRVWHTGA